MTHRSIGLASLLILAVVTAACSDDDPGTDPAGTTVTGSTGGSAGSGGSGGSGAGTTAGGSSSGGSSSGGSTSLDGECEDWQSAHPEWLWCDDFETEHDLNTNYDDTGLTGLSVSDADALSGSYGLQQHYTAGQVDAGWISKFYGDTLGGDYGPIQHHFYMRWFHKFEDGFQCCPAKMARITSIGPGWDKRFGVYYWIEDQEIVADVSTANGWLPIQRSGFSFAEPGNIGRWICHEMYVKANTPGQSDGEYTFWADGVPIVEITGVSLVGSTDFHFNNTMLDAYWNGGSPADQNRTYDNLVISTERIGCGAGGG